MGREHFIARKEVSDRRNKKNQSPAHRRSLKQERALAIRGGGTLTVGSGNKREKGDIKQYHKVFRVEAKTTTKKSFSVKRDMMEKLEDSSIPAGEFPAIIIEFIDENENVLSEVAVIPTYLLKMIADGILDG